MSLIYGKETFVSQNIKIIDKKKMYKQFSKEIEMTKKYTEGKKKVYGRL